MQIEICIAYKGLKVYLECMDTFMVCDWKYAYFYVLRQFFLGFILNQYLHN